MRNMFLQTDDEISLEAIGRLAKDPIVEKLTGFVSELRKIAEDGKLVEGDSVNNTNKHTKKLLKNIEKDLHKRFGINFNIDLRINSNYIFYVPITDLGATASQSEGYYDILEDIITNDKTYKDTIYEKIYDSAKKTRAKILNSNDLRIDFNNAKIYGMEDDYAGRISIDPSVLFNVNMTDKEITAIIMHEIGHGFSKFAYINKTFGSVLSTMEGLMDVKGDKNKIINLTNELFGTNFDNANDLLFGIVKGEFINHDKNMYTFTNDESTADQFAVRFGLGSELATSLSRLYGISVESENGDYGDRALYCLKTYLLYTILGMILVTISPSNPAFLFAASILFITASSCLSISIIYGLIHAYNSTNKDSNNKKSGYSEVQQVEFTYDRIVDRIKRMKLDLNRQLRTLDLTKEDKSNILQSISIIDKQIKRFKNTYDYSYTNFGTAVSMLFNGHDSISKREFFIKIEELTENDLHHQQEKFKQLLG